MLKRIAIALLMTVALARPLRAAEVTPAPAPNAVAAPDAAPEKEHQLMDPDVESGIWTLIIFFILLYVLNKFAWKNVLGSLKGREERIRNDIAQAEEARIKAEATLKEYNAQLAAAEARGREILAKATTDALALAERIKTEAEKAAHDRGQRAAKDIADARDQALREIYEQAADLSTRIAEKILRRNLNADDQRDLVAQSLEQVQAVNRG